MSHKQTHITLSNGAGHIRCDAGIRGLILAMNVPGLETYNSCQGGSKRTKDGDAYVQYGGPKAALFTSGLLAEMIDAPKGLLGGLRFVHDNEGDNSGWPECFAFYYLPYDYKAVRRLARAAVARWIL